MAPREVYSRLQVRNFAQIVKADIEFGDLTVLVGPQGSGKSLLLQLWKLALDSNEILRTLWDAGDVIESRRELLEVYFGQGMADAWRRETRVRVDGGALKIVGSGGKVSWGRPPVGRVFFIPAHRALLLAQGWPAPMQQLTAETPTVARLFSHNLYELFGEPSDHGRLFPQWGWLIAPFRQAVEQAVFHGGQVFVAKARLRRRLELRYGRSRLPFMAWTAGQREFTPLLLGLLHLLDPARGRKQPGIDWVVIEEPEMGLHPQAISVTMLFVLDLLRRGYRVVLSTHAPLVLDIVFALTRLKQSHHARKGALLARAFGVPNNIQTGPVMAAAMTKSYRTFALRFSSRNMVISEDITDLDPSSPKPLEAGWGGLTSFSSAFNEVVAEAINAR